MGEEDNFDRELEQIKQEKIKELQGKSESKDFSEHPKSPVTVTDENLNKLAEKYPLLVVDCWAEWCAPCRPMGEIIDALAEEFSGQIVFGKLNIDQNRDTAMNYRISSIPQLLIFSKSEVVDKIVGLQPKEKIASKLRKYL